MDGYDALDFYYVDRELSPLRTANKDAPRRSLDLLLANAHDQTPIFAELKIRGDKLAYFALIQVLMLALEFVVPAKALDCALTRLQRRSRGQTQDRSRTFTSSLSNPR